MIVYRSSELFDWLEPLLSNAEFAVGELLEEEAAMARLEIPVGDHWA